MKRNKFSLSHYKLLSCDMGHLIPIGMYEVLPGDTVQQSTSALIRVSPLLSPVMHPVHVRIHHWYVPYRLIWDNFEDFITGGPDNMDVSEVPYITLPAGGFAKSSLADYLGIPPGVSNADLKLSALPFRAYASIWNEFYRDQDLQTELDISTDDGLDAVTSKNLMRVNWEKDYFTSARPWPQKGPDITIPIGDYAPLTITGGTVTQKNVAFSTTVKSNDIGQATLGASHHTLSATTPQQVLNLQGIADLTQAAGIGANAFREMFALQRYAEARARYGSRYSEYLRYLGVASSDARLQRPEYLGGGRQTIQFSEVLQTAEGVNPVGEMRGHGIGAMRSNRYRRFIEEHGLVLTLLSVKPKTIYTQSLHRSWLRRTKEDFFQKELQHIGQQEVFNAELYAAHTNPLDSFGYQDRYDEYRRSHSTIAGDFRDTLDHWHYARIFATQPALNSDFVSAVPTKRTHAVPSEDVLFIMAQHSIQARRLLASRGTSKLF